MGERREGWQEEGREKRRVTGIGEREVKGDRKRGEMREG